MSYYFHGKILMFPPVKSIDLFTYVFPRGMCFFSWWLPMVVLFRREWKCMCVTESDLWSLLQNKFPSSLTFLFLMHLHPDSAEWRAYIAPSHTWLSALLEQKDYNWCTVFFTAVVQCCIEQLSLFCTVLFFLQNCLWQFVLILYYPRVLQAIK